jgi:hypothetical protein
MRAYLKVDFIFSGSFDVLNLSFFEELVPHATYYNFNYPDYENKSGFTDIVNVFQKETDVDFSLSVDRYVFGEDRSALGVFFNFTLRENKSELLMFFDLNDLFVERLSEVLDFLYEWADSFKRKYHFDYFICKMDNGNDDEFYFDLKGKGPLYS